MSGAEEFLGAVNLSRRGRRTSEDIRDVVISNLLRLSTARRRSCISLTQFSVLNIKYKIGLYRQALALGVRNTSLNPKP
jgi:hypothetical protein